MSNPRALVNFEGLGADYATFKSDGTTVAYDVTQASGSAAVGLAVTLSAAGTVALAADGDRVVGKLLAVASDGMASVQYCGFMSLPGGTGAALTLNSAIVGALLSTAKGYIRAAASGTAAELVKCTGNIVDAADTTAVMVNLC